jgi:type VI secretion system protein ImpA
VRALAAATDYFTRCEPSNPAVMILRQAQELVGKSFLDVLKALVPDQVAKAAVNIGNEHSFSLPLDRLVASPASPPSGLSNQPDLGEPGNFDAPTRTEALVLLQQVSGYLRMAEPSSPIPFLIDRAGDLAQRDFLSVLKALLPANTLKTGP